MNSTGRARQSFALGRASFIALLLCLFGGCAASKLEKPHARAPKVNIPDFISHTAAYKGKSISLTLKLDDPGPQGQERSFRDYLGREVKFIALGPRGERLRIVIMLPAGLSVPDIAGSEEVIVRFVCARGSLRGGNEAKSIEKR